MKRKYFSLIILLVLASFNISAKSEKAPIKVAILDTGYDFDSTWYNAKRKGLKVPKLCKDGHKDFTGTGIKDNHGHGTHVAGIVASNVQNDSKYCLLILKTNDPNTQSRPINTVTQAIQYAIDQKVKIINYSGGGPAFDFKEYLTVKKALDKGIVIVTAAGNDGNKIDHMIQNVKAKYEYQTKRDSKKLVVHSYEVTYINKKTLEVSTTAPKNMYYPALYDPRIIAVQNYKDGKRVKSSNYGEAFTYYDEGYNINSLQPNDRYGLMTGTSMAAPQKTADIINGWLNR